jgi:hypothetical protein
MTGLVAIKHRVVSWKGDAPMGPGVGGECDGEPLEETIAED